MAAAGMLRTQSAGSKHRVLRTQSAWNRHSELDNADSGEQIVQVRAVAWDIGRGWMAFVEEPFPVVRPLLLHGLDDVVQLLDGVCHRTRRTGLTG